MTVRLWMLAHAETAATRRAAFASDEGLDTRGRAAVATLARPRGDQALTSPAPAARETAAGVGLESVVVEPALRDLDVGAWTGRTLADVAAADPESAAAFIADPTFAGHGGESIVALIERMRVWMDDLRGRRGCIVAVTHPAVVRAAAVAVLAAPPSAFWRIDVAPLGHLAFGSDGRRWTLRAAADR